LVLASDVAVSHTFPIDVLFRTGGLAVVMAVSHIAVPVIYNPSQMFATHQRGGIVEVEDPGY